MQIATKDTYYVENLVHNYIEITVKRGIITLIPVTTDTIKLHVAVTA